MLKRRTLAVGFTVVVIISMFAIPASGAGYTRGEPDIDVYLPEPEVTPGEDASLELHLLNDGDLEVGTQRDQVLTARGTTVEITDEGPFDVHTGTLSVGTVQDGATVTASPQITVPEGIEPGEYKMTVRVAYSYTRYVSPNNNMADTETVRTDHTVIVRVLPESRFEIVNVTGGVQPGTGGAPTVEIKNVGDETAREARATISGGGDLEFDGGTAETTLGTLDSGDTVTVDLDASLPIDATRAPKPISATISYRDSNGRDQEATALGGSITPLPKQNFDLDGLDASLSVGYGGVITGTIVNDGPRPVEAAVIQINADSDAFEFDAQQVTLPDLDEGESASFRFKTGINPTVDPGPRQVTFTVEYRSDDRTRIESDPIIRSLDVAEQQFAVSAPEKPLSVGYGGQITSTISIDDGNAIDDGVLVVDSRSDVLQFDDASVALPRMEDGDSVDFSYKVRVQSDANPGPREVTFTVEYRNALGEMIQSDPVTRRVEVREQRFDVVDFSDTLSVGYNGEIRGTLVAEDGHAIDDGVLVIEPGSEALFIDEKRYALPSVDAGESVDFRYPVDVSGQADAGPRQVTFTVEYRDATGSVVQSDPITRRVVVSKRQPEFSLAAEDGTIEAGGSTTLVIEITNDRPEQLSNIDARLYAESPFDSTSDEAFVPALAPGESAELRFQLSAAAETMAKTYPVEFDFQFETEDGDTVISDTYQYPVEVQPPSEDDSGFPFEIALVGIALVVILGAGIVLRRRDRLPW